MEKKSQERFLEENWRRQIQHSLRWKSKKKISHKLYVQSKGYNNLFKSWKDQTKIRI